MKFPLASEKSYVFMYVWICLMTWKKGEVGDEQVLSKLFTREGLGHKGFLHSMERSTHSLQVYIGNKELPVHIPETQKCNSCQCIAGREIPRAINIGLNYVVFYMLLL